MTRIVCTRDAMNRKMLNTFKTQALTRTYANIVLHGMRAIKCEFPSYNLILIQDFSLTISTIPVEKRGKTSLHTNEFIEMWCFSFIFSDKYIRMPCTCSYAHSLAHTNKLMLIFWVPAGVLSFLFSYYGQNKND